MAMPPVRGSMCLFVCLIMVSFCNFGSVCHRILLACSAQVLLFVSVSPASMAGHCARVGYDERHRERHREKPREGVGYHTRNCSGHGRGKRARSVVRAGEPMRGAAALEGRAGSDAAAGREYSVFELPRGLKRGAADVGETVSFWCSRHLAGRSHLAGGSFILSPQVAEAWRLFGVLVSQYPERELCRELRLYAFSEEEPQGRRLHMVNVDRLGVAAGAGDLYDLQTVCGIDPRVQCRVAMQVSTIIALQHAVVTIIGNDLHEFGFASRYGCHRSVAMAMLVAELVFQRADVVCYSTPRILEAAWAAGMTCVP